VTDGAQPDELVGPDHLQQVVQSERAELWRLLYVALTRARNHLVLPLPAKVYGDEFRDQWIETLKRGLEYDSGTDSYSLSTPSGAIDIGVNDADFFASHATQQHDTADTIVGTMPPQQATLSQWSPRDLSPSTLHPITENPAEHALSHLLGKSIHTESNDTSDGLNLPFDEMGPDQIGSAIHDTLTGLIGRDVSEAKLEAREDVVTRVFNDVVDESVPAISEDARQRLWDFFSNILGDFLRSDLWKNIQQAESVRVEKSVDGLIKTDGIGVTLSGQVDIVMDMPSDERVVTDIKIALAHPTDETQRRYNSQVLSYAYLYGRQEGAIQSVRPTIETFGFTRKTASLSGWPELIEHRIRQLSG
jgi:ATP-dependent helicase/nuclease subunit A